MSKKKYPAHEPVCIEWSEVDPEQIEDYVSNCRSSNDSSIIEQVRQRISLSKKELEKDWEHHVSDRTNH